MTTVMIDPQLAAKLTSNGGKVLLTDSSGKALGHFVALDRPALNAPDWMCREPTLEEFRAALADPKRYTTEEVMKLLEDE